MSVTSSWTPNMAPSAMAHGTAAMQTGYALATSVVSDVLTAHAPAYNLALQQIGASTTPSILVVDGCFDQVHHILESAKLPYARLGNPANFAQALDELPGIKTVFINCGRDFPANQAKRVAKFVHAGGMLMTTDWALKTVIQEAFPGTIAHKGGNTGSDKFVLVDAWKSNTLPAPGKNALVHMMDAEGGEPRWWLEHQSYPITRLSDGVEILLYSRQLKAAHNRGSIMVRFKWGDGWVYHMISHAFLQHKAPSTFAPCSADPADADQTRVFTESVAASPKTQAAYTAAEAEVTGFDAAAAKNTSVSLASVLIPLAIHTAEPIDTNAHSANLYGAGQQNGSSPQAWASPDISADQGGSVFAVPAEGSLDPDIAIHEVGHAQLDAPPEGAAAFTGPGRFARIWQGLWGWLRSLGRGNG
ncbi:MAG: hypothetical protein HN337_06720 [Deltaproteobacteria bacterium]|jgi:hypothetical protein|nr:hypothetical protein [Deltaproteobacteria bacterium]